ncbi:hypothetical protein ACX93W_26585 [Paenibacillus sp. CAU 1782]
MAVSDNQYKYWSNMAAGKTSTGGQATTGNQAWSKAQLAKVPAPPTTPKPTMTPVTGSVPAPTQTAPAQAAPSAVSVPEPPKTPTTFSSPQYNDWMAKQNEAFSNLEKLMATPFQYNPETDPAYQAQRQLAQNRAQSASNSTLESMNERGIMGSSLTANQLGQIQQNAEQEALAYIPQYREQAYSQYQNQLANAGNLLSQARSLRGDQFNEGVTEAQLTGNYMSPEARTLMNNLLDLKSTTEANWSNMTPEQQAAARSQGDQLRAQLQGLGVDSSLFGANVTSNNARGNFGQAGLRTLAGQQQDYNISADQRDYNRGVLESDRNFERGVLESDRGYNEDVRRYNQDFEYTQGRDSVKDAQWQQEFDRILKQDGIDNAIAWANLNLSRQRESRIAASEGASKTKEYTGGVISDPNMPRNASQMETWLINNVPGGKKVQGPVAADQRSWYEGMILNNPNLSESDITKLYNRFGIPLPQ